MSLDKDSITRYSRHILLKQVGRAGQEKLGQARVLVVGAGGLGCPVSMYLAAAGVGTLGLSDGDQVDLTNLQRQVLHWEKDLDRPKVESAAEKLGQMNSAMKLEIHPALDPSNIEAVISQYDLVVEGTDNFASKFLVNDACVKTGTALVQGGILRFEGQMMAVKPGESACYRCLFVEPPPAGSVPNCAEAGVLGAVAGSLGSLMAVEVLKLITGAGEPLLNRLLTMNAETARFREVAFKRNASCGACGTGECLTPLAWTGNDGPACEVDPAVAS